MKKLLLSIFATLMLLSLTVPSMGQIRTPAPSPSSEIKQTVGLTDISIYYSRPGMKGRTIFSADGLVPYGKIWRTGANQATKIHFSDDVKVGGKELKKGAYAILTIPEATKWTVNFYEYESGNFGSYVEKEPAASATAEVGTLPFEVESFSIGFNNIKSNSADLMMFWSTAMVAVPISVDVDSKVMADIKRVMAGPSANDYYAAASYLHDSGKDMDKALKFINKATAGDDPKFWQVRRKALILADMGKTADAIAAAKQSMELAKTAGNDDYIRMNEKSIKEWEMK